MTTATAGAVNILSVGEGHISLSFNSIDPAERIRAARIVKDMIRRGYALLVAVPSPDGGEPTWSRALEFDENTTEYIIADFDPTTAGPEIKQEAAPPPDDPPPRTPDRPDKPRGSRPRGRVKAGSSELVAVGRTAGG
jgi:hypothetical protein